MVMMTMTHSRAGISRPVAQLRDQILLTGESGSGYRSLSSVMDRSRCFIKFDGVDLHMIDDLCFKVLCVFEKTDRMFGVFFAR